MKDYYDGKYTYWPGNSESVTYLLIVPTMRKTIF